jgi:hypothetical protein
MTYSDPDLRPECIDCACIITVQPLACEECNHDVCSGCIVKDDESEEMLCSACAGRRE